LYEGNRVVFAGEPMLLNTVGRPTASASGVWAVDHATDTLHVISATMPAEVFVPTVERLLTIEGRTKVSLTGLTFADMDFRSTGVQEGFNVADQSPGCPHDGAVAISRSTDVMVRNCTFLALGGGGVLVGNASTRVSVEDSSFVSIGQSAVMFVGNETTQATDASVIRNTIDGVGVLLASAGGVLVTSASNVSIRSNRITNSSRWGVAVRSNPGAASYNITVEGNTIINTGLTTADFGAISFIDHTVPGEVAARASTLSAITAHGPLIRSSVRNNCVRSSMGMRDA
jgi:hypothetical protein